MLRIGIDARFAVHQRRGIGNYTLHLLQHLAELDRENHFFLYVDREDIEGVLPRGPNFTVKRIGPSLYPVWEQVSLPLQAFRDGLDVLHCTGNTAPVVLSSRIALVTSVMDVMYMKDKEVLPQSSSIYQRLGRIYRRLIVPFAVSRSKLVITISQFSRADIRSHFPRLSDSRVCVTYLAPNELFHTKTAQDPELLRRLGVEEGYLLSLGGYDPRKNTARVISAFAELKQSCPFPEKLVLAGIPCWQQSPFWQQVQDLGLTGEIVFTDFLSEKQLVYLYNNAIAFLYPSLYEGFGLPPLEAMACGVPVLTSNVTSIPEIVGNAAIVVDPTDIAALKVGITSLLEQPELRAELVALGRARVSEFSWRRLAEETLGLYKQANMGAKR